MAFEGENAAALAKDIAAFAKSRDGGAIVIEVRTRPQTTRSFRPSAAAIPPHNDLLLKN
jgi:hypothetical protein